MTSAQKKSWAREKHERQKHRRKHPRAVYLPPGHGEMARFIDRFAESMFKAAANAERMRGGLRAR